MHISFYGGAGKVTGSNFLVTEGDTKVLVDCGIEQGKDFCEPCVYGDFPYNPKEVSALVVTHAHLDHIGRIPKLVKDGFAGDIYMTPPTKDLAELILRDSVEILRSEAKKHNRPPLYEEKDVDATFSRVQTLEYHKEKEIAPGFFAYLRDAGHILGSASVRITNKDGVTAVFTGDIGNSPSPLLPDWEPVPDADVLIMESVYGNRVHPKKHDRVANMKHVLKQAIEHGGAILIPAFSLERTQLMLYELSNFFDAEDLPHVPVFLDSPLAIKVTEVYEKWGSAYFKPEAQDEMKREKSLFQFSFLRQTKAIEDSRDIDTVPNPKIIIAGAGMSHGGRIGGHEIKHLPDPKTTLITVGYQAPGSPGRLLEEGVSRIKLEGKEVAVRAHVAKLEGWSAHADRDELLRFAEAALAKSRPKAIFTALGEPAPARFLAQRIHDYLGARAIVPQEGETWEITKGNIRKI